MATDIAWTCHRDRRGRLPQALKSAGAVTLFLLAISSWDLSTSRVTKVSILAFELSNGFWSKLLSR